MLVDIEIRFVCLKRYLYASLILKTAVTVDGARHGDILITKRDFRIATRTGHPLLLPASIVLAYLCGLTSRTFVGAFTLDQIRCL